MLNVCCKHFSTIKRKMAGIVVSPLDAALYGSNVVVNDNTMKVYNPVEIETDISNENVFRSLLQLIKTEVGRRSDFESGNVLYDTIKSNVYACKMFSSRHVGRCCITNKNYGDMDENLKGCVFAGAIDALGDRWIFSTFPYHVSAKHLLPIAELMFNMSEYIVPLIDFPNINKENKFIVVNVKRSNGTIQRGIIKCNSQSMVTYRAREGAAFIHPSYAPDSPIVPYIKVHFNADYSDIDIDFEGDYPFTDGYKGVFLKDVIEVNPDLSDLFQIGDELIPTFKTAFLHSTNKY